MGGALDKNRGVGFCGKTRTCALDRLVRKNSCAHGRNTPFRKSRNVEHQARPTSVMGHFARPARSGAPQSYKGFKETRAITFPIDRAPESAAISKA